MAKHIEELLREVGVSRRELQRRGFSAWTLRRWELGRVVPRAASLRRLAIVLDLPFERVANAALARVEERRR